MSCIFDVEEKFGRTWTDSVSWTIFQVNLLSPVLLLQLRLIRKRNVADKCAKFL